MGGVRLLRPRQFLDAPVVFWMEQRRERSAGDALDAALAAFAEVVGDEG